MNQYLPNKFVLDRIQVAIERSLACDHINSQSPKLEARFEFMTHSIVFEYRDYVLGLKERPIVVTLPLAPWQSWWQRWAPDWLLRRFPVKPLTCTVDAQMIFPYFNFKVPEDCGKPVILYSYAPLKSN